MTKFFSIPFGASGDLLAVPNATQPDGSVSYSQGFGPDYQRKTDGTDLLAKTVPRNSTNAIFNDITGAIGEIQLYGYALWQSAGAPYPLNAIVRHNNVIWRSKIANNSSTPVAGTDWETAFPVAATETTAGIIEIATQAEVSAGTDNLKAVTSLRLKQALTDTALGGIPTAATAAPGTSTTQLATTSFVQSAVTAATPAATETVSGKTRYSTQAEVNAGAVVSAATKPDQVKALFDSGAYFGGVTTVSIDGTALDATVIGRAVVINSAVSTLVMTPAASIRTGGAVTVHNLKGTSGSVTINRSGSDFFSINGGGTTSISLKPGEYATFYRISAAIWYVIGSVSSSAISLGIDQAYQSLTGSRVSGVTYTNTTGRPIFVAVSVTSGSVSAVCGGVSISSVGFSAAFIVPDGLTYSVTATSSITSWAELR